MREMPVEKLKSRLEEEGFVVVHDFLDPAAVTIAHDEIEDWYLRDQEERKQKSITEPMYDGSAGKTILTKPTHLMLDVYGKSPTLDSLFERILSDPESAGLLRALAGRNLKLRGYNIKKMTGAHDPRPDVGPAPNPHEWHRDSPYEICIAVFLDDFSQPNNGTTALMSGSHRFPYCPRWSCLFGPPFALSRIFRLQLGIGMFLRFNLFNHLLARRVGKLATGAYGKRGDFYIFINDVWHGREPNTHGNNHMMLMVGAFPTEIPYPDKVVAPDPEILATLPSSLRAAAAQVLPQNNGADTILRRMHERRARDRFPILFHLARVERYVAEIYSIAYFWLKRTIAHF
ncbi:MAG TPA: phytanoyl-CoA dioxygenase family protein [Burkholderiales bacterium]|nr:phytanoyl-CoA dioxygenase family protein [Burkholderiales bacterium]